MSIAINYLLIQLRFHVNTVFAKSTWISYWKIPWRITSFYVPNAKDSISFRLKALLSTDVSKSLDIELNKFKQSQIYEDCKMVLNEAKKHIADIDALQEDPENFFYSYFERIKKQVDLRKEELKLKLDL